MTVTDKQKAGASRELVALSARDPEPHVRFWLSRISALPQPFELQVRDNELQKVGLSGN